MSTMERGLLQAFDKADRGLVCDVHDLEGDRLQILWVLTVAKQRPELEWLSPAEVAQILRDCCGVSVTRQRVAAILTREKGAVAVRQSNAKRLFKIMKVGAQQIDGTLPQVYYVDPASAHRGIEKVEEILGALAGDLKICDPYVDNRSLDFLSECISAKAMQLLTVNIFRDSKFRRDLKALNQERADLLEVRVHTLGLLHDRYIIHEN